MANPTQYLNSIEYIIQTNTEYENHLVVASEFIEQIEKLGAMHEEDIWCSRIVDDIKKYPDPGSHWKSWRRVFLLMKDACKRFNPNELIVGNLGDPILYSLVLDLGKSKKVVALDDGIPSISILRARNRGSFYSKYHVLPLRSAIRLLLGINKILLFTPVLPEIYFFSMFKLKGGLQDEVRFNDYSWLRDKVIGQVDSKSAFFIGSHVVERGIIAKDTYLNAIQTIAKQVSEEGFQMRYVPHRAESAKVLNDIGQMVPLCKINIPIEFAFLNSAVPKLIIGNFTSALFTLSRIYSNSEVRSYLFHHNSIRGSRNETKADIVRVQNEIALDPLIINRPIPE